MKLNRNIFYLLPIFILTSCSVGIQTSIIKNYPPLEPTQEVRVLNIEEPAPANAIEVGNVSIYDNMTIHCDSEVVFAAAKNEARKAGGNILKITEHLYPNFASSCHRIKGRILKADTLAELSNDTLIGKQAPKVVLPQSKNKHDYRIALNAGWSWQTSEISNDLTQFEKDYLSELKSGSQFGGEFNYFLNHKTAIGAMVNFFHSSNSVYATVQPPTGPPLSGTLSDNINIMYIAPTLTWRVQSPTKMNAFLFGFSIGYLHYKDDAQFINSLKGEGSTLGLSYDLSYDMGLSSKTSLGIGFSWKLGTLSSLDVTQNGSTQKITFDEDNRLGIGHIDLSLGLRFR